jgi:AraC-like DNA-binding protein
VPADKVHLARPAPILGAPELLRATYVTQRFPRHTHDGYGFGVIERGALGFRYRGEEVVAPAGAINLVVPDEPHTGQAAAADGWTYRMFYLRAELLEAVHREVAGAAAGLPHFRPGVLHDPRLAARLVALHRAIAAAAAPRLALEHDLLALLAAFIRRHATPRAPGGGPAPAPRHLARVRERLHAGFADEISLAELGALAGLTPWHVARGFTQAFGVPPHTYQIQVRVAEARRLLARGHTAAAAAAAAGFSDQSHLTRHFKRLTGMTPGRYRKAVQA